MHGVEVRLVRHGILRQFSRHTRMPGAPRRNRILFWREGSEDNGATDCIAAFRQLAPLFPQFTFDLALRHCSNEVPGIDELAQRHANINVFRFPYPDGIDMERLLRESICAVLPFRHLTIHPQLAIAETLAAGTPVICTNIGSAAELVADGRNGALVTPGDPDSLARSIQDYLLRQANDALDHDLIAADFREKWNWDHYAEEVGTLFTRVRQSR